MRYKPSPVGSYLEHFESWAREQWVPKGAWEVDGTSAQVEVEAFGRRVLNLASDDALGFSSDARVKEAAQSALRRYGSAPVAGARVVRELEEAFAQKLGLEAAVASSSATDLWRLLLGRADRVLVDERTQLGLGASLTEATLTVVPSDDLDAVQALPPAAAPLWVTLATLPFEGDLPPLAGPAETARGMNAAWLVDESYSLGVLGRTGSGALEHQRLQGVAALVFTRLDTALASSGAIVAGPKAAIAYLKSELPEAALLSAPAAAAAGKSLELIEREPARRARLFDVAARLHEGLQAAGFDTGPSVTPRIPVWVGDSIRAQRFSRELRENGVWFRVAYGHGPWLLATPSATLSDDKIQLVLETVVRVSKKLSLALPARSVDATPVTLARPDVQVTARPADARWFPTLRDNAAPREPDDSRALEETDWKHRVFDGLERLTWRATNLRSQHLRAVFQKSRTLRALLAPRRKG